MSKHVFTDEQIKELNNNPYVISVTSKYVNYSEEFKKLFLKDCNDGMSPIVIISLWRSFDFTKICTSVS